MVIVRNTYSVALRVWIENVYNCRNKLAYVDSAIDVGHCIAARKLEPWSWRWVWGCKRLLCERGGGWLEWASTECAGDSTQRIAINVHSCTLKFCPLIRKLRAVNSCLSMRSSCFNVIAFLVLQRCLSEQSQHSGILAVPTCVQTIFTAFLYLPEQMNRSSCSFSNVLQCSMNSKALHY